MEKYDCIVVGSGHAGCESALMCARRGLRTMMLTLNLDSIAYLACNPSIGGTAKGQLVGEIDALGGQMGKTADATTIQRRMLNTSKGVAVQSLRAQVDKVEYHTYMKKVLENEPNLYIRQGECSEILHDGDIITGVKTAQGDVYESKAVILCTGVYLNSRIIVGDYTKECGPNGFCNATKLTDSLIDLGFKIMRFKTGTPVRVDGKTIDYSVLEVQKGDDDIPPFSLTTVNPPKNVIDCYLTYTNASTHKLILDNLSLAPMYSGKIKGRGPRYCPSIEDKVVRFADKERHQLFLEPEALSTNEVYVQGFSTSMPTFMQKQMVQTLSGLEHARIMRDAYAIEYDCIDPTQLSASLMSKNYKGLFFAGQINGTSGYEEAGAQGVVAGINAVQYCMDKEPMILGRSDGYIGVLIDDLVTKGTNEPYRMMTSRAEHRLLLRQDNADLRLHDFAIKYGVCDKKYTDIYNKYVQELEFIKSKLDIRLRPKEVFCEYFEKMGENMPENGISLRGAICRHGIDLFDLIQYAISYTNTTEELLEISKCSKRAIDQINIQVKYDGYLKKEYEQIERAKKEESVKLDGIDYDDVKGLRIEARQKLKEIQPYSIGQASRISGVSPADIMVLTIYIKTKKN